MGENTAKLNHILKALKLPDDLSAADKKAVESHINAIISITGMRKNTAKRNRIEEIITMCDSIANQQFQVDYRPSKLNDDIDTIGLAVNGLANVLDNSIDKLNHYDKRIQGLIEVITNYANLNFDVEASISNDEDELDAIAYGLNLLGQEIKFYKDKLEEQTYSLQEAQRVGKIGSWSFIPSLGHVKGSKEFFNIYELPAQEFINADVFNSLIEEKHRNKLSELAAKCMQDKKPYAYEYPITTTTGKKKYIKAFGELLINNGVETLFGTILDITEIHKAKQELINLNANLEQKVKERTADLESFTYSVSHDLRSPLRAIHAFSEILQEDFSSVLDKEGKRIIGVITSNVNKMSQLIDDLLQYSRLNKTQLSLSKINLNQLIEEVKKEVSASYPEQTIQFQVDSLPFINADQVLIKQVWQNLIDNAVKYSSREPVIKINIKAQQDKKWTNITITDNGVGFNEQYQHKLFDVFQRLHGQEEFSGTGVGLSIVKRIMDKHQGKITAKSTLNKGASFTLSFPTP